VTGRRTWWSESIVLLEIVQVDRTKESKAFGYIALHTQELGIHGYVAYKLRMLQARSTA